MGGKKIERITFAASAEFCEELDEARGDHTRAAVCRGMLESGIRLRRGALKSWVGEGSARAVLRDHGSVGVDRSEL